MYGTWKAPSTFTWLVKVNNSLPDLDSAGLASLFLPKQTNDLNFEWVVTPLKNCSYVTVYEGFLPKVCHKFRMTIHRSCPFVLYLFKPDQGTTMRTQGPLLIQSISQILLALSHCSVEVSSHYALVSYHIPPLTNTTSTVLVPPEIQHVY